MRNSLRGMLLMVPMIVACGSDEKKIPGLLDSYGVGADALYRRGNRLYTPVGDSIYSLDVSDPRHMRETDTDAWGDVTCSVACPGYFWQDGYVFTVGHDTEVAKVMLPNGTIPEWVYAPRAFQDGYTESSVRLSDDRIAFAQSIGSGLGRLLIIQIDPSPAVIGSLDVGFSLLTAAVHSSGFLFLSTNSLAEEDTLLVFDVRDPANPVFHEMIDLGMGSDLRPEALVARGEDLFVSARLDNETFQFNWYRFADDFRSVRMIQRNTDIYATPAEWRKPVFYDRFLFVPGGQFGDEGRGVAVYAIDDTSAGLQFVRHTPKGDPGAILVDNQHRLAFYGGGGVYAMDLDYVLGLTD